MGGSAGVDSGREEQGHEAGRTVVRVAGARDTVPWLVRPILVCWLLK